MRGLLTGSSFNHHFSAVFSLYRDAEQPDSIVLDVDVADRFRGPVEKLAATYLSGDVAGSWTEAVVHDVTRVASRGTIRRQARAHLSSARDCRSIHFTPGDTLAQIQARIDPKATRAAALPLALDQQLGLYSIDGVRPSTCRSSSGLSGSARGSGPLPCGGLGARATT